MACVDDLITYYTNVPFLSISDDNLPKYAELLNHVADFTVKEYSECRPILKEKEITTAPGQNFIDIYNDIDENYMDYIIFDEKRNLLNGIWIKDLQMYLTPILLDPLKRTISFLNIQYSYDVLYMLKEYFENKGMLYIYEGRKIKCKPETTYYILYEAYRTREEIFPRDCKDFEDLFKVNLVSNIIDSFFFTDEQPIKSVSISGISVTFNVENKESIRKQLTEIKSRIKNKICNIYEFVERW